MQLYILLYNLFLKLYLAAIHVTRRWNPKAAKWLNGRKNLIQIVRSRVKTHKPVMWMHCSSLGEFEQGRPVLEQFRKEHPSYQIILTFFSPSGYEIRKAYDKADHVFYLPFGGRKAASEFIDSINPRIVIWVKYDYWYHYLNLLHQKQIPVLLISAIFRRNQVFFKWYGKLHREMLRYFDQLFVQTHESVGLLEELRITGNVTVSGDTRFDRVLEIAVTAAELPEVKAFAGNLPLVVAGSTWREDEEELCPYFNDRAGIKLVLAPHEIPEHHLEQIEKFFDSTVRYSRFLRAFKADQHSAIEQFRNTQVLIIDNIGLLSLLYQYATVTYIGGGYSKDGVHNVLEAAVYGKPVFHGPEYSKYHEAVGLVEAGGAFPVIDGREFEKKINLFLSNEEFYRRSCESARRFVEGNAGATKKILQYVETKLSKG